MALLNQHGASLKRKGSIRSPGAIGAANNMNGSQELMTSVCAARYGGVSRSLQRVARDGNPQVKVIFQDCGANPGSSSVSVDSAGGVCDASSNTQGTRTFWGE